MTDTALAIRTTVDRYNMMVEFVKTIMQDGKDYGKFPGIGKPSLLKPGAEKLNSLFELYPVYRPAAVVVDWDKPLFFYQYECSLVHRKTGETWGVGLGSCNSRESKYRYRYIPTDKKPSKADAEVMKAQGLGRWRKDGNDWVWSERIENDQIYDIVNTIDKMAQKRALIAATLIACNASEFFTQDVEDISIVGDYVEGEWKESKTIEPESVPAPAPVVYDDNLPVMELETAMAIRNRDGVAYGDLTTEKLTYMANAMRKRIEKNNLSGDELEEIQHKLSAAQTILAERAKAVA